MILIKHIPTDKWLRRKSNVGLYPKDSPWHNPDAVSRNYLVVADFSKATAFASIGGAKNAVNKRVWNSSLGRGGRFVTTTPTCFEFYELTGNGKPDGTVIRKCP